jgi:hypothetical protein
MAQLVFAALDEEGGAADLQQYVRRATTFIRRDLSQAPSLAQSFFGERR